MAYDTNCEAEVVGGTSRSAMFRRPVLVTIRPLFGDLSPQSVDGLGCHPSCRPFEPLDSECLEHAGGRRLARLAKVEREAVEELLLLTAHGALVALSHLRRSVVPTTKPRGAVA